MLLVYSRGIILVHSLFSNEADLIHHAFSVSASPMFNPEDGGTDGGPCCLELLSRTLIFDFIIVRIGGSLLDSTLKSDFDSSSPSISD